MPILSNARHERFAQELAKGASQIEAYRIAGYEPIEANASRLIRNDKVAARVAELKAAAAEETICTIHDIARQLDEDRQFARELAAPAAAISATMGKAKVLGHLTEKHEHTGRNGGPIQTEELSQTEIARRIAFTLASAARETAH
jgi:phage terminase small subunit